MIEKYSKSFQRELLKGHKLYHFTSFESFVKIWLSKKILFGDVTHVNDLLEYHHTLEFPNLSCLPVTNAFQDIRNSFRQISFTMDDEKGEGYKNFLMWGQYANRGKGVCIELDFDKLEQHYGESMIDDMVTYISPLRKLDIFDNLITKRDIRNYIFNHRKQIFFTKKSEWTFENEYRIISDKDDGLNISDAISTVYLASCKSDECQFVEELLKGFSIDVRALRITTNTSEVIIEDVNPAEWREKIEKDRFINQQAEDFYIEHRNEEDTCLIMEIKGGHRAI